MAVALSYEDPVEGFRGWLSYDGRDHRLAAGGCRCQPGLTGATLDELSARMTLKERVLGVNVDGAKCGIDYDPFAPGADAALQRFLGFLREELMTRLSMGPDMGTQWRQLERLAANEGIPSVKYAVKHAQGLDDDDYFRRIALLDEQVGPMTLGQRRAGHALAHAALAAARIVLGGNGARITCALQGFGTLGRAAASSLAEHDVKITAIADEHGCVSNWRGLDLDRMLAAPQGAPVTTLAGDAVSLPGEDLFETPCDVLVLAATSDAMSPQQAESCAAPVVVVGANVGLRPSVEMQLERRGTIVVPDFIGGIGGSASMEALFGCERTPTAQGVLDRVEVLMRCLIDDLCDTATTQGQPLRKAALSVAANREPGGDERPYGSCPYLAPVSL